MLATSRLSHLAFVTFHWRYLYNCSTFNWQTVAVTVSWQPFPSRFPLVRSLLLPSPFSRILEFSFSLPLSIMASHSCHDLPLGPVLFQESGVHKKRTKGYTHTHTHKKKWDAWLLTIVSRKQNAPSHLCISWAVTTFQLFYSLVSIFFCTRLSQGSYRTIPPAPFFLRQDRQTSKETKAILLSIKEARRAHE